MIRLLSIADFVTNINAVFGFLAIIFIFSNEIRFSFSFILLAILADGLDGIIARKTKKGKIGDYLEAMADMLSLAVAPMVFVYKVYFDVFSNDIFIHFVVGLVLVMFLSLSIIRLSSFHVLKEKIFFIGLPSSAATIIILVFSSVQLDLAYVLIIIILLSIFMISKVRFPKLSIKINAVAFILIIITLIFWNSYNYASLFLLLSAIIIYSVAGPIYIKKLFR